MKAEAIFQKLWDRYAGENPSAGKIHRLFSEGGDKVVNDHVAFRTFDDPRVNIEVLSRPFLDAGYTAMADYRFEAKKLRARHFEIPGDSTAPRVFISELILGDCSPELGRVIREVLDGVQAEVFRDPELIFRGSVFGKSSYAVYEQLRKESEYAAWLYVFGFRANHFTVSINHLEKFEGIFEVNTFLKDNGFPLNSSGGEIKGSAEQLLEQSSTLADRVEVEFLEGSREIPSCYYEFARRYPREDGSLFSDFIAGSADKIFESTHFR